MRPPSTDWQESVEPDEAERFARYAEQFVEFQQRKSDHYGKGRALHRKQLMALQGKLEVLPDLPSHARHGLFAQPASYDALLRLSSASPDVKSDRTPDIRGLAVKVLGVSGPGALGTGPTTQQDFVMINLPTFRLPTPDPFVGVVVAAAKGNATVLAYLLRRYGPFGFLAQARRGVASLRHPFSGYATEPFYTAAPIACGPFAVRARLEPAAHDHHVTPADGAWAADMRARLARGPVVRNLQLQFFVDEATTPIEDASVDWPESDAPFITVALLTVPTQETIGEPARALAKQVESSKFDPWNALAEHRPLGEVMRARRIVYYASQKARGASS